MSKRKIKIGILLDSYEIYAWMFNSIERVINLDFVEFSLIIFCESKDTSKSRLDKFWQNRNNLVYNIFDKIDQFLFRKILFHGKQDAFEPKYLKEILPDLPIINVKPIRKKYSDYFEAKDIEKIRNQKLDIILRLSRERILRGGILSCSKYGIWSDHHADNYVNRGAPPGFWEVFGNVPQTGSILQILTEDLDGGMVLYRSWSSTYPFSPAWNRNLFYWASSSFLPRQVKLLYNVGEKEFFKRINRLNKDINFYSHRLFLRPNNFETFKIFGRYLINIIFKIYQKLRYQNYGYLLYSYNSGLNASIRKFKKINFQKEISCADPHVVNKNGIFYIFFSEHNQKNNKSHISVVELDGNNMIKKPVPVLKKDYSLVYPFVFNWEDKYYMIPQSYNNNTLDLYECNKFPDKWDFKMSLMENVKVVSPTILHYEDKWWLFVGLSENQISSPDNELFLFYSDKLFTNKWHPHPLNPVISDIRLARPAGKIFLHNNFMYRPSRNGAKWNEHSININKIIIINETEYEEKIVDTITPDWDKKVKSTNTFSYHDEITILDAFKLKRRFL